MMIEPSFLGTLFVRLLTVTGHGHQNDFTEFKLLTNFLRHLKAIHPRQPNIQQNQIWPVFTGRFQGRWTVVNRLNLVTIRFQQHGQRLSRIYVVVHNQHPQRRTLAAPVSGERDGESETGADTEGNRTTNSLPCPGVLLASTLPPCITTSRSTKANPIPKPP